MRFWQAIAILLASFTMISAANVPVRQRDTSEPLFKRQVVAANICATVGPLTVPNILPALPRIPVISSICLCTQGGVLTPESLARLNTQFTAAQNGGILDPVLGVTGNTVASLLNLILGQATGQVNNSGGTCRNTIPPNGFPTCSSATAAPGSCSFGCNSGFKVCGSGCIPDAQVCPSGTRRRAMDTRNICAVGWEACPVQNGKNVVFECVNTSSDLESCGGCPGLSSRGVDCSALPGVGTVSCVQGRCKVHNCMRGFTNATESGCTPKTARTLASTGVVFQ